jgi:very-short-patch-repair endonuclease
MREDSVMRIATAQHGAISAAQLAAAGLGRRAIERRLADGGLRRIHRGVYLVGPVESPYARHAAALLGAGRTAVLSHRTAAELWELLPPRPGPIHVTVTDRGPRSRQGIHVHATTTLPQSEVRRRHHLRLTSPERTLIDLPGSELERAVEEARVRRLVTDGSLSAAVQARRPGAARLAARLDHHTPSLTRSEAERRMVALIRSADLPPPRTNARVGRYEVDMVWQRERLIVEVDGFAYHHTRAAFERDRARDAELQARGYRVIRITWRHMETRPHTVIARLAAALAVAA